MRLSVAGKVTGLSKQQKCMISMKISITTLIDARLCPLPVGVSVAKLVSKNLDEGIDLNSQTIISPKESNLRTKSN